MYTENELVFSLTEREQAVLSRSAEARRRGIDVHGNCERGAIVAVRDHRSRIAGFMARQQFDNFSFLHSAVFTDEVAEVLYEQAFRRAVGDSVALFLALADNHFACEIGQRFGAFAVNLDTLDEVIPEFVDTIRDFPPGGYYRAGPELRNIHDAPEEKTIVFMVTAMSYKRAERERVAAAQQVARRTVAEHELSRALEVQGRRAALERASA